MKKYHWFDTYFSFTFDVQLISTFFSFTFDVQLMSTLYLYLPKLHLCKIKVKQTNSIRKVFVNSYLG